MDIINYAAEKHELLCLQCCLDHNRETIERLDCQKKLLLRQVLKLEFAVEDAARDRDAYRQQLTKAKKELSVAKRVARAADAPPGSMMSEIITLWDDLSVPLAHRSRFAQAAKRLLSRSPRSSSPSDGTHATLAQDKQVMYFELMRLRWMRQVMNRTTDGRDDVQASVLTRHAKCTRGLASERRDLAKKMKRKLNAEDLDAYFLEYDIDVASKHRKKQLTESLWATGHTEAMHQLSSELVQRLMAPGNDVEGNGDGGGADGGGRGALPLEDVVFGDLIG